MISTRFGAKLCTACGRWRDHSAGNCQEQAMRSTEESTDPLGQLGPRVPAPAPAPAEQWRKTDTPGVLQDQAGRLRTDLPMPKVPT